MKKSNFLSSIRSKSVVLAFSCLALMSCSKEDVSDELNSGADQASNGAPKLATYLFSVSNGAAPYRLGVHQGSDQGYGTSVQQNNPNFGYTVNTATLAGIQGSTTPCGVLIDPLKCRFTKGPNATTLGPTYYVQANQGGGKYLQVQFYGVVIPAPPVGSTSWFTYNVATNTWTIAPGATAFCSYTQVTSHPIFAC